MSLTSYRAAPPRERGAPVKDRAENRSDRVNEFLSSRRRLSLAASYSSIA